MPLGECTVKCFWCGNSRGCYDNRGDVPYFECYICGAISEDLERFGLIYEEEDVLREDS